MKFHEGQDVEVEFDGMMHRGEVIEHRHGVVMAVIEVDPLGDYGSGTERLAPQQTVAVAESKVRPVRDTP